MPLITTAHDSLPYIDPDLTPAQRAAAELLISSELDTASNTTPHPLLPPLPESNFSPLMTTEMSRIEAQQPIAGIDLSRYEELSPPAPGASAATSSKDSWASLLTKAYASSAYLSTRLSHLQALESTGKETWLSGNEVLVRILKKLEEELAGTKEEIDRVAVERRNAQEAVRGEIEVLERTWRSGVGRVLETEVAAEGLRQDTLEKRRQGA